MGSIFYMKRNGQKYAYESTSVRVPGRKNPKTIRHSKFQGGLTS